MMGAAFFFMSAAQVSAQTSFTLLHSFTGGPNDGLYPQGSLFSDGPTLYGTTYSGGASDDGTIFSIQTEKSGFTLLHSFTGGASDGTSPYGSLFSDGPTLYGMTLSGGASGRGTIFSIQTDNSGFTLLHTFTGGANDGRSPNGNLLSDGPTLYGMTRYGGASGRGTIFSIQSDSSGFTLLHTFTGGADDGSSPYDSLISDGSTLYGMTRSGGASNIGTIFSIQSDSSGFTLLHSFTGGADDGTSPYGSLLSYGSTLYGMTHAGGASDYGTIFSIQTDNSGFTLLHTFTGGANDGSLPRGNLIFDGSTLYGMTTGGGFSDVGTIFSIRTDSSGFTLLHTFTGGADDGSSPYDSLISDGSTLYGMTESGGASDYGVVFSLGLATPSVPPWITDYNGDGTSDIAIFRGGSGLWAIRGVTRVYFGSSTDETVPGDYNGNGTTEIGIFRSASGLWAIRSTTRAYFGGGSDLPEPGDYDGDGTADIGIFRGTSGLWAIRGITRAYFGGSADSPAAGYYGGYSTKAIGIFRGASGLWAIRNITRVYFGSSSDTIVPGDYDGDGTWETGIFRETSGLWAIRGVTRSYFGSGSDRPVPGIYKGDGIDDIGIYRGTSGLWAVRGITRAYFGGSGDIPVTR